MTDWEKCIRCLKDMTNMLRCSFDSTRHDTAEGADYKTLVENIGFEKIGDLPGALKLSRIDEG